MTFWNQIMIWFGAEICEYCGSADVIQQGYEESGHYHVCKKCGMITYVS